MNLYCYTFEGCNKSRIYVRTDRHLATDKSALSAAKKLGIYMQIFMKFKFEP